MLWALEIFRLRFSLKVKVGEGTSFEGKVGEYVCAPRCSRAYSGLRYAAWPESERERKHSLTNKRLGRACPASTHALVNSARASSSAHPSTLRGHFLSELLEPDDNQMKETLV